MRLRGLVVVGKKQGIDGHAGIGQLLGHEHRLRRERIAIAAGDEGGREIAGDVIGHRRGLDGRVVHEILHAGIGPENGAQEPAEIAVEIDAVYTIGAAKEQGADQIAGRDGRLKADACGIFGRGDDRRGL